MEKTVRSKVNITAGIFAILFTIGLVIFRLVNYFVNKFDYWEWMTYHYDGFETAMILIGDWANIVVPFFAYTLLSIWFFVRNKGLFITSFVALLLNYFFQYLFPWIIQFVVYDASFESSYVLMPFILDSFYFVLFVALALFAGLATFSESTGIKVTALILAIFTLLYDPISAFLYPFLSWGGFELGNIATNFLLFFTVFLWLYLAYILYIVSVIQKPKTIIVNQTRSYYNVPVQNQYAQQQYQQNAYTAPAQNQYQQNAYAAPVQNQYQQNAYAAPVQNQYQQNAYAAPVQNQYQQNAYTAPTQSQYQQSTYTAPVQDQYNYGQPVQAASPAPVVDDVPETMPLVEDPDATTLLN